jgi:hypothetical protein
MGAKAGDHVWQQPRMPESFPSNPYIEAAANPQLDKVVSAKRSFPHV